MATTGLGGTAVESQDVKVGEENKNQEQKPNQKRHEAPYRPHSLRDDATKIRNDVSMFM